jgi:hypothetical protein
MKEEYNTKFGEGMRTGIYIICRKNVEIKLLNLIQKLGTAPQGNNTVILDVIPFIDLKKILTL